MYPHSKNGFTLIEVLISMLLLSLIMIYVVNIINQSSNTNDKVIAEDREFLQVEASLERINLDFSQIYSPLYYTFQGNMKGFSISENYPRQSKERIPIPEILNPEKSTLIFKTAVNRRKLENSKQSHYAWVRYSLRKSTLKDNEKKRTGGDYELIRQLTSSNPYIKQHDWNEVKEQLLVRHVKEAEFSFWSNKEKKFLSRLRELGKDRRVLRGMKVNLVWIDANNNEWKNERYFRPLWPEFSAKKEQQQYQRELARQKKLEQQKKRKGRPRPGKLDKEREENERN